jgi:hypothetical protein
MRHFLLPTLFLLVTFVSCKKDFSVTAACTDLIPSEVRLPLGFLGLCASGAEGTTQPMRVSISVDGLTVDEQGQTVTLNYVATFQFNKTNANNGGNAPDNVFPVQLPACGTYAITVVVRGRDDSCWLMFPFG